MDGEKVRPAVISDVEDEHEDTSQRLSPFSSNEGESPKISAESPVVIPLLSTHPVSLVLPPIASNISKEANPSNSKQYEKSTSITTGNLISEGLIQCDHFSKATESTVIEEVKKESIAASSFESTYVEQSKSQADSTLDHFDSSSNSNTCMSSVNLAASSVSLVDTIIRTDLPEPHSILKSNLENVPVSTDSGASLHYDTVAVSPTSSNSVTNWSLQHLLSTGGHSTETETSNPPAQSQGEPDELLLNSPEKSIEQAVSAALCTLERDMQNVDKSHVNEDSVPAFDDVVHERNVESPLTELQDSEESTHVQQDPGHKSNLNNESKETRTEKDNVCGVNTANKAVASQKIPYKRMKLDFDPDNIQYTHKPLARTKKPYKPTTEKRSIKNYWFRQFPWLVFDQEKNLFFCSYCTAVKCDNIFTRGRPAIKPRKDYMIKHESTTPHKTAMSRLKIIPDQSHNGRIKTDETENRAESSTFRQMEQFLHKKIPDEIDVSTAHLLKFIPSERSGPENRNIHERWFLEFSWFVYNHKQERFYCKICKEAGVKGVYTDGKPAVNPKKGDLQVHERTAQHINVLRKLGLPTPTKKGCLKSRISSHKDNTDDENNGALSKIDESVHVANNEKDHHNINTTVTDEEESTPNVSLELSESDVEARTNSDHKEKSPVKRKIKAQWFIDFPWLEYNRMDDCFYCKQCRKFNQPGVYSTGKRATMPKKDNFVKHEDTENHHVALLQEAGLNKEEALEQVTNGNSTKNTLVMGSASSEEPDVMRYIDGAVEQTGLYCIQSEQQHTQSEGSKVIQHENREENENLCSQSDSALNILASMSIDSTVPNKDTGGRNHYPDVKMEWFLEFTWLELDELTLKLFCRYCKYFDPCGIFSVGKVAGLTKYDDVKRHSSSEPHRQSLLMHTEQYPGTIQDIQRLNTVTDESRDTKSLDQVIPHYWSILFPWMQHDQATDTLFCRPCQQDDMSGSWVTGVARTQISMEEIEEHEQLVSHRTAIVQYKRRHLSTLATQAASLANDSTQKKSKKMLKKSSKIKKVRPDRTRYKDMIPDSIAVESVTDESNDYSGWKEAFWNMASKLRNLGILCDITLSVGSSPNNLKMFQAHKLVLVCASEFFKACLRDNSLEQYYHFNNVSIKGMEGILSFMYGEHDNVDPKYYREVYKAANIFAIPMAKTFYKSLIKEQEKVKVNQCVPNDCFDAQSKGEEEGNNKDVEIGRRDETNTNSEEHTKNKTEIDLLTGRKTDHSEFDNYIHQSTSEGKQSDHTLIARSLPHGSRGVRRSCRLTQDKSYKAAGALQQQTTPDGRKFVTRTLPTCNVCGKRFLRIGFLKRHKERQHFKNRDKRMYKCDFCPKVCRTPKDIKLHRRLHTGERPFLCNQCGKAFTRRETLMEHAYVHKPDSEKPHKCSECGKGFFKQYDLQRHFTGIHSGLKPFQCHLCGKSFAWSRSLQDHLSGHVGKSRPFTCDVCDMTFVRKYDLQRHQVKHETKKPFRCTWCGRFFTQKGSMDKHQRDYCRSKPSKKKTVNMPTNLQTVSVVTHQQLQGIQAPQQYDQPVNLTAGVKDMSVTSAEFSHPQTTSSNAVDIESSAPQNPLNQGPRAFPFPISTGLLPQSHVYPPPVSGTGTSGELYHNSSLWVPSQTLDATNPTLFHHHTVN